MVKILNINLCMKFTYMRTPNKNTLFHKIIKLKTKNYTKLFKIQSNMTFEYSVNHLCSQKKMHTYQW